ncbi:hypothetical protein BT93_H3776 [Corymbia citriodora subsp. variegata]|nr:hypothetical protein BT93_H3776 [Corymbia citriodora subsp. variegata]
MTGQPRNQGIIRDKSPLQHFIEQVERFLEIAHPGICRYMGYQEQSFFVSRSSKASAFGVHTNKMVDNERVAGESAGSCRASSVFGDLSCDERYVGIHGWDDIVKNVGMHQLSLPWISA